MKIEIPEYNNKIAESLLNLPDLIKQNLFNDLAKIYGINSEDIFSRIIHHE